jgi:hypothetical protein
LFCNQIILLRLFFVKLVFMRWRTGYVWAIVGSLALIVALAFACHPEFAASSAAGMSAPPAPKTSIEAAPLDKLLQSHFDWCGGTLRQSFSHAPAMFRASALGRHDADARRQSYGPLYRRPPPSLS